MTATPPPKLPPNQTRLGGRRLAGATPPKALPPGSHPPAAPPSPPADTAGPVAAGVPHVGEVITPVDTAAEAGSDLAVGAADVTLGGGSGLHPVELAGLLHELSAHLLSADTLAAALDRLAGFTARAVPGVLRCSVTLISDGEPLTLAGSGPEAQGLDDLQYAVGQGPGLDAARTRAMVMSHDLPADARWPDLADRARADRVRSVVALPLDAQRSSVGSLTLFVARPAGIVPELLLTAMAIVSQAEVLLAEHGRRETAAHTATVDHAIGVIIAQRGCGVAEAYDVLRETAHQLGMDHHAVAERLVAAAARNAATARQAAPARRPTSARPAVPASPAVPVRPAAPAPRPVRGG